MVFHLTDLFALKFIRKLSSIIKGRLFGFPFQSIWLNGKHYKKWSCTSIFSAKGEKKWLIESTTKHFHKICFYYLQILQNCEFCQGFRYSVWNTKLRIFKIEKSPSRDMLPMNTLMEEKKQVMLNKNGFHYRDMSKLLTLFSIFRPVRKKNYMPTPPEVEHCSLRALWNESSQ